MHLPPISNNAAHPTCYGKGGTWAAALGQLLPSKVAAIEPRTLVFPVIPLLMIYFL